MMRVGVPAERIGSRAEKPFGRNRPPWQTFRLGRRQGRDHLTEALQASPGERPGFYYETVIAAGGNMGQARRILAALVAGGKVKAEGTKPRNRYSLA